MPVLIDETTEFLKKRWIHWKTSGHPYVADIMAACTASVFVSPFVTMVDKAVMENASGRCNIWVSMGNTIKSIVLKPHQFVVRPEFLLVTSVYCITYGVANTVDTNGKLRAEARSRMEERASADPAYKLPPPGLVSRHLSTSTIQLLSTTAANMFSSMTKDSILTKMFGSGPVRGFPLPSFGAFMCRDIITIAAGFTIPGPLANVMKSKSTLSQSTCDISAQLLCPISMQVICTPVHLFGLDYYNRPDVTFSDRVNFIKGQYRTVVAVRMGRTLPAFGLGGLGNKYFRRVYKEALAPSA